MKKISSIIICAVIIIIAAFAIFTEISVSYSDIKGHPAEKSIKRLAKAHIVSGKNGAFRPDDYVTRAEFMEAVSLAFDLDENCDLSQYSDLDKNAPYYEYAKKSADLLPNYLLPITTAPTMKAYIDKEGKLLPDAYAVRMHMAEALAKIKLKKEGLTPALPHIFEIQRYISSAFGDYAYKTQVDALTVPQNIKRMYEYTYLASKLDIMQSNEKGLFNPYSYVTRAELSVILDKMLSDNNKTSYDIDVLFGEGKGVFTIAVIPDTQQEVVVDSQIENKALERRNQWIAQNQKTHNIKAVVHTGDLVNWGDADPSQLKFATGAFDVLEELGIPVALALGNHDTAAVGVGGSAADPANTHTRLRDTTAFNKYFPCDRFSGFIPFEEGKIDNGCFKFQAEGKNWMIVTLELWARQEAITWAQKQIADAPDHNVIIATHSYLNSDATIKNGGSYGDMGPLYLYDTLIKQYENIKIVLSGHTGASNIREDVGVNGNKIVSILGSFHDNHDNPLRLLRINANEGTIEGPVYYSLSNSYRQEFTVYASGLEFIEAD